MSLMISSTPSAPHSSFTGNRPHISHLHLQKILTRLNYAYPIILIFFFLGFIAIRSIVSASTTDRKSITQYGPGGKPLPPRHTSYTSSKNSRFIFTRNQILLFEWLVAAICFTFLCDAANVIIHTLYDRHEQWWCGQATVIYVVGSFFVFALFLISLVDTKTGPSTAHFATWIVAFFIELVLLLLSISLYTSGALYQNLNALSVKRWGHRMDSWEVIEVMIAIFRITFILGFVGCYMFCKGKSSAEKHNSGESTGLLSENGQANGNGHTYGSTVAKHHSPTGSPPAGWTRPDTVPARGWWEYITGYSVFFPYLWPSKDKKLQSIVLVCFLIVTIQRGVNILVPIQVGKITNQLSGEEGNLHVPWFGICLFIFLRLLQGSQGLLGAIRSVLWVPVSQYSYRQLSIASFEHVHSLSLDFHLGKRTGEVLSALGKGSSINNFLEQVTFQMVPMVVDLFVAMAYLLIAFDAYYALVIAVVLFWYVYITVRMAQWRVEVRRVMVNADREQDAVKNDSMVSYETVKYFNAEAYEFNRYHNAVEKYQTAERKVTLTLNLMNVTQNVIFVLGVMVASFIAAYQVTIGKLTVGKFVELLTYLAQLQQPLNFFGTFYRSIQSSMINAERLLELFKEKPTVVDSPTAQPMPNCEGDIRFDNVHFAYDNRKEALEGLDFRCSPGTTTALVGESGGGKSTVFRLLFRYYNSQAGNIRVDNHDVQDLTIDSLRRHFGVVPQDTVLFNETLMYNLKYANPDATDENVYAACRAASIHDRILSFPDGYHTAVGERGLRLSGGEKQRVAIARTILKNPRIILLDEATAALDTETEERIQEALTTLSKGRTMLVIAHRLSTITRANQILVLHEGKVAERGTHEELLAKKGRYAMMWKKQVRAQRAAEEARVLKDKADRLRRESRDGSVGPNCGSSSQSEDEGLRGMAASQGSSSTESSSSSDEEKTASKSRNGRSNSVNTTTGAYKKPEKPKDGEGAIDVGKQ